MTSPGSASVFAGFRFPREVIAVAVRWYLRYGLPYRDVEELLAERGITVDHVTHGQVLDVLLSERRDLAAARRFFTRALRAGTVPAEVTTDRAPAYPRVLAELIPSALHITERYANSRLEADHGRLTARLRPMRGLKRQRSARILAAGHALVQNIRRGHYELAPDVPDRHRLRVAFDQLTTAI
ncbi:MAG: IS6 family transposase [Streptosporangiaceae bacterium]